MKLFNKPKWLKPEIEDPIYWLHLVIIVGLVYWMINQFIQPMDITLLIVFQGVLLVGIADIIAHTALQLD